MSLPIHMNVFLLVVVAVVLLATGFAYKQPTVRFGKSTRRFLSEEPEMDPNFEAHLPSMLKAGTQERTDHDLAKQLRSRYMKMSETKRKAATTIKTTNAELAAELEEIAEEMEETHEKFVQAALQYDAWSRPSPELPRELREEAEKQKMQVDPNFDAHLPDMLKKGSAERPSYDLPSELRLLKYKQAADVKRLAAKEIRKTANPENEALAAELDEIAAEMEESHQRFVEMANAFKARSEVDNTSVSNR